MSIGSETIKAIEDGLIKYAEDSGYTGFATLGLILKLGADFYNKVNSDIETRDYGALVADTALVAGAVAVAWAVSTGLEVAIGAYAVQAVGEFYTALALRAAGAAAAGLDDRFHETSVMER